MREADGLLCTVTDRVDAGLFARRGRRARIVANFGVGVNNIDLDAARAAGVAVTNTPGVLTDATADIAMALMLAATRRMSETEAILRSGGWDGWRPTGWLGMGLQDKVLGILGMGRIGAAVARRAVLGFGMRVVYFNRSPVGPFDFPAEARPTVEAVLAEADVVSLHVPGGGGNSGLVSAERLAGDEAGRLPRQHGARRRRRRGGARRRAGERPARRGGARRLRRGAEGAGAAAGGSRT